MSTYGRFWVSPEDHVSEKSDAFARALPEIVCAHLFGLYAGLRLPAISRQLAWSVFQRTEHKRRLNSRWEMLAKTVEAESLTPDFPPQQIRVGSGEDSVLVEISNPLRTLTSSLLKIGQQQEAMDAIRIADKELDSWWDRHQARQDPRIVTLPFGIQLRFP